jgi:hypothetical protein
MKEAIDEVLAAEKEAAALLDQARRRADEIHRAAEAAAADEAKAARDRSAERVREALERADEPAPAAAPLAARPGKA